jgi:predicted N-formylglutamate amidohydrolase
MPRTQPALEDVDPLEQPFLPGQFVISVEHASNRIPASYHDLGLSRRQLHSHIAWDPGARTLARTCAKAFGCPCREGRYSRLLVDLNRSLHHPKLMAPASFSIPIPGNRRLSPAEKIHRIRRYYTPFREAVLKDVRRAIESHGRCVHLSMHSFTPRVGREVRQAEIGLLYDPQRPLERLLVDQLVRRLREDAFHVRRNYPYRGTNDGHTTHLRKILDRRHYAGLEIELNQRLVQSETAARNIARRLEEAILSLTGG